MVDVSSYYWEQLKAISEELQAGRKAPSDFGIDISRQSKAQLTKDGFTLVDVGTYAGDYQGFTFMGDLGVSHRMNATSINSGGYANSELNGLLEDYYNGSNSLGVAINPDIKSVIKPVNVVANTGNSNISSGDFNSTLIGAHVFLPSVQEIGGYISSGWVGADYYRLEGVTFDYYMNGHGFDETHEAIQTSLSWVRSAFANNDSYFRYTTIYGDVMYKDAASESAICVAFVI